MDLKNKLRISFREIKKVKAGDKLICTKEYKTKIKTKETNFMCICESLFRPGEPLNL